MTAWLKDVHGYGTHAARPAAGSEGALYYETDTDTLFRDNGSTWNALTLGSVSPLTTKGDVYVHGSSDARLPVGSDGQVLTADSTQALGVKWAAGGGGGSLSTANATLGADVTMTTSGTWYDAVSVSLAAGTWLVHADILVLVGSGNFVSAFKVYQGSTVYAGAEMEANYFWSRLSGSALITLGSTTTVKLAAASNSAGSTIKAAAGDFTIGNYATQLNCVKVA